MRELKIKKCLNCGAMIKVIEDCHCACNFICCDEKMADIMPNSTDAALEKHVPTYEIKGDKIIVNVNHVMDADHYIEWISFVNDDKEETVYFEPGKEAKAEFPYQKGTLYSYCNKHGLWHQIVK